MGDVFKPELRSLDRRNTSASAELSTVGLHFDKFQEEE